MFNQADELTFVETKCNCGVTVGLSKKDIARRKSNLKTRLEELETRAKMDPMKREIKLHEEIAQIRRKLAESD